MIIAYPTTSIISQVDSPVTQSIKPNCPWDIWRTALWTVELKASEIKNHILSDLIIKNGSEIWQIIYIDSKINKIFHKRTLFAQDVEFFMRNNGYL